MKSYIALGKLSCSVSPSSSSFLLTYIQVTTRSELARLAMGTIFLVGERSEPLSRVFNDQPRDIYINTMAVFRAENI